MSPVLVRWEGTSISPSFVLSSGAVKSGHHLQAISTSAPVWLLHLSPPLAPCHIPGCSPGSVSHHGLLLCPGDSSVGTSEGSGAGRKGSITVTNNCVLTN